MLSPNIATLHHQSWPSLASQHVIGSIFDQVVMVVVRGKRGFTFPCPTREVAGVTVRSRLKPWVVNAEDSLTRLFVQRMDRSQLVLPARPLRIDEELELKVSI